MFLEVTYNEGGTFEFTISDKDGCHARSRDARTILLAAFVLCQHRNRGVTLVPGEGGGLKILTSDGGPEEFNSWNIPPAVVEVVCTEAGTIDFTPREVRDHADPDA